jgi:hypothetical protein
VLLAPVGKADMDSRIAAELAGTGLQVGRAQDEASKVLQPPARASTHQAQRALAPAAEAHPAGP